MDPETIEALQVFFKTALIIGGGCAVTLGTLWAMCAAVINYSNRASRKRELQPLYEQGKLATKPTVWNVTRIPEQPSMIPGSPGTTGNAPAP